MPPLPREPEHLNRVNIVSIAMHSLLISAVVVDLVFTEIAANREDNDTIPFAPPSSSSPSPLVHPNLRPVRRLVVFGIFFIIYLVLKAYELVQSNTWYFYKKSLDELSLLAGGFSLIALVYATTIKFTRYVAFPAYVVVVGGRYLILATGLHEWVSERIYIKGLQIIKFLSHCYGTLAIVIAREKQKRAYLNAHYAARNFVSRPSDEGAYTNFQTKEAVYRERQDAYAAAIQANTNRMIEWDATIEAARARGVGGGNEGGANEGGGGGNEDGANERGGGGGNEDGGNEDGANEGGGGGGNEDGANEGGGGNEDGANEGGGGGVNEGGGGNN